MSNLQKIKDLAASVKNSLAALTVQPETLDDLDSITNQRISLREKLAVLKDAEAVEVERIETASVAAKAEQRRKLLLDIADKSDSLVKQYQEQTDHVVKLIDQLMEALVKRENLFNIDSVKLSSQITFDLLSHKERGILIDELERASVNINSGQFSMSWRTAAVKYSEANQKLTWALRDLVKPTREIDKPLSGARSFLADRARKMIDESSKVISLNLQ